MIFNNTAVSLFNESDTYFNLLIYENDKNLNVYKDLEKNIIAAELYSINYKIVTVEEIVEIDSEFYYKINYQDKIKGYFKALYSVIIIPKVRQQVKLSMHSKFLNGLNNHLSLEQDQFEAARSKISYSSYYAAYGDEIYEGIVHREVLIGFSENTDLSYLVKLRKDFKFLKEAVIYTDSSLTQEHTTVTTGDDVFKSEFIIPEEGVVRFKYENDTCWCHYSDTSISKIPYKFVPNNASDALIQSIMYQYKDKLRKSHSYHLKILNQEIRKIRRDMY